MATLQKQEPPGSRQPPTLEDEVHQLERQERQLERRTDGLELKEWISIAVSAFALAAAIFAVTVALTDDDDDGGSQTASAPAVKTGPAPASARPAVLKIPVALGEMYVKPSTRRITEGRVRFVVHNVGAVEHELIVAKRPLMMEGPGMPMHEQGLGMTEHMGPGAREQLNLEMTPGKYELFCNVPGHYAAGQRTSFTVTKQ